VSLPDSCDTNRQTVLTHRSSGRPPASGGQCRPSRYWRECFESRSKGTPEPRVFAHARSYQSTRMANLRDGYFGRSPYIFQRLKRAVSLAAAEDREVVRPEPEQVLVSVVALHEDALHLSLAFHRSPPRYAGHSSPSSCASTARSDSMYRCSTV